MGISSALYTALTGLNVNESAIDVIGNNVANSNTVGFKSSDVVFTTQFSQIMSMGTAPGPDSGGLNPMQTGLGVTTGTTTQDFSQGTIQTTGGRTDLAIQGDGFFILSDSNTQDQLYTRNGSMHLDGSNYLISGDGRRVQGYQIDGNFNLIVGVLGDLQVPVGNMRRAQATSNATLAGNLNASGTVATQGTIIQSQQLYDGAVAGPDATAGTLLTNLFDDNGAVFGVGDVITLAGHKGGRQLGEKTHTVAAGEDVQDLLDFMVGAMGVNTDAAVPGSAGGRVVAGRIEIEGNYGTVNDIAIESGDMETSGGASQPMQFGATQTADGESVYTSFIAYDSLGNPIRLEVSAYFEQADTQGNTFRVMMESGDDTDESAVLGTAELTFDNEGQITSTTGTTVNIDRDDTGAIDPMQVVFDFSNINGLASTTSELVITNQDGSPEGTLINFNIDANGRIVGTFDNGLTRDLGQVALARFTNPEGLVAEPGNVWRQGPNSGEAITSTPNTIGLGSIISGALELSNTDLARNFVNLILASTGFSAASRVITTTDELLREVLSLGR